MTDVTLELKYKTLNQRINKIDNAFKALSIIANCESEIKGISVIKEQFTRMYNQIIRTGQYSKYQEVEDAVISQVARIEFKLDERIYKYSKLHKNIISKCALGIKESANCKEFQKIDDELEKVESMKELLKIYSPYITKQVRWSAKSEIETCKFNLLLRKELEGFVTRNNLQHSKYCKEVLEQLVNKFQKAYDCGKTSEIKEQVYYAKTDDDLQVKELVKEIMHSVYTIFETTGTYKTWYDILNEVSHEHLLDRIFIDIQETKNYKKAHNLETELKKIELIKKLVKEYGPSDEERSNKINKRISTFKFKLLFRRQLEQMIYENGGKKSKFLRYDSEEERKVFEDLFSKYIEKVGFEDELLEGLQLFHIFKTVEEEHRLEKVKVDMDEKNSLAKDIIKDNIMTNYIVYKIIEKDIEKDANKYIELLEAPVFNPHMCNISDDPYSEYIPYAEADSGNDWKDRKSGNHLERKKVNLSLLISVLDIISDKNTTIMECDNIYKRFGFKCRPITINEGQELIYKVYDKVREKIRKTKVIDKGKTNGQKCTCYLTGYNYDFEPTVTPFITTAEITKKCTELGHPLESIEKDFISLIGKRDLNLSEQKRICDLRIGIMNWNKARCSSGWGTWKESPLHFWKLTETPFPIKEEYLGCRHSGMEWENFNCHIPNKQVLWESYQKDFEELGIRIEENKKTICPKLSSSFPIIINLDDIADLPIDYEKINILSVRNESEVEEELEK